MTIQESRFLKELDEERNKSYFLKIIILDKNENPMQEIEGRALPGSSISINGSSSVRRTCNISLVADEKYNDFTDIDNLLSINKKIKILVGLIKKIDYNKDIIYLDGNLPQKGQAGYIYAKQLDATYYKWNEKRWVQLDSIYDYQEDLIWFPMGIYVIEQPNLSYSNSAYTISLSCKDKMCLLNGELGGNLPASVTFHEYNQQIGSVIVPNDSYTYPPVDEPNEYNIYAYNNKFYKWSEEYGWEETVENTDNKVVSIPQLYYDVIQTVVANYGNESLAKIIINDVPREIKQIVRYTGSSPLYYNSETGQYTTDEGYKTAEGTWKVFSYNEDIGYVYTDWVVAGELVTNIGDNVCTVLDKIKNALGNYEYFYDIDGNFVFQEIKNYLNTSYDATKDTYNVKPYYIDNNKQDSVTMEMNSLKLLGKENYRVDLYGDQKSAYTFEEGSGLVVSYNNIVNYSDLKNDFHIWGKNPNNDNAIHYHVAIKEIPKEFTTREVVFFKDSNGKYTGKIKLLGQDYTVEDVLPAKNSLYLKNLDPENIAFDTHLNDLKAITNTGATKSVVVEPTIDMARDVNIFKLTSGVSVVEYTPSDWRAELYLQGLQAIKEKRRPDKYQQELLDLFDSIYEWGYYDDNGIWQFEGRFKSESVYKPNTLSYWIDFLEPVDNLYGMSVDDIEAKICSYQQDKIIKIYTDEIPNHIILDTSMDSEYLKKMQEKCTDAGQPYANVNHDLYTKFVPNTIGYSAQEVARNLMYQYTIYNSSISIQSVPIYYLDVNTRITVEDSKTDIHGDYIINNITLPLDPSTTMTITASKALNRI